ncbi:hypothetical protein KYQ80_16225 [Escherichia coli]|nr:hypothetical protein [Escherichia coli]
MLKSPLFWKMTTLFGAVLLLLIPIMLIGEPAEFGKNRTLRFSGHP